MRSAWRGAQGAAGAEEVWNFAYGANLSNHKLEAVRRITPLERVPGVLPGWRLRFAHRGGPSKEGVSWSS